MNTGWTGPDPGRAADQPDRLITRLVGGGRDGTGRHPLSPSISLPFELASRLRKGIQRVVTSNCRGVSQFSSVHTPVTTTNRATTASDPRAAADSRPRRCGLRFRVRCGSESLNPSQFESCLLRSRSKNGDQRKPTRRVRAPTDFDIKRRLKRNKDL